MTATGGARRSIATFHDYASAQHAVDTLAERGVSAHRVAIVGTGLRHAKHVYGRLTIGHASLAGACSGALLGLVFAALFGLFTGGQAFLGVLVYSLAVGMICGAILGAIGHAVAGGRHDFSSTEHLQAARYDVQGDIEIADRAAALLHETEPAAHARA
jgi:hypothetical protein